MNEESITARIEELKKAREGYIKQANQLQAAREQCIAQLNACNGALQELEKLLGEETDKDKLAEAK